MSTHGTPSKKRLSPGLRRPTKQQKRRTQPPACPAPSCPQEQQTQTQHEHACTQVRRECGWLRNETRTHLALGS